jgi:hypothetical protein
MQVQEKEEWTTHVKWRIPLEHVLDFKVIIEARARPKWIVVFHWLYEQG